MLNLQDLMATFPHPLSLAAGVSALKPSKPPRIVNFRLQA